MNHPELILDGQVFAEPLQRFGIGEWFAIQDHDERMGRLVSTQLGATTLEAALAAAAAGQAIRHPRVLALHAAGAAERGATVDVDLLRERLARCS